MVSVALLSTPWPLFNRPSIQLGALKAFLRREVRGIFVDAHHVYLGIAGTLGYDLYNRISVRTWLSEAVYGALLYPERQDIISRLWHKRPSRPRKPGFDEICRVVREASKAFIAGRDWKAYQLVGFSVCFGQLTSALYFARKIRERAPSLKIVFGGSSCAGDLGRSFLRAFPDIDFIISGEGEEPLAHLARWVASPGASDLPAPMAGLFFSGDDGSIPSEKSSQVPGLDDLPLPDYEDYFRQLDSLAPRKHFFPEIPVEISRGCWWRKPSPLYHHRGCAFCNLNLQWKGYRAKSRKRIISELKTFAERYRVLSVSFMDNLLPMDQSVTLFQGIAQLGKDLRLFGEIRGTASLAELAAMGSAGMAEVQVGIEALSTGLLRKINKGTTVIENLEMMRNCEASDMPTLLANLITQFPGSDEKDVEETLINLAFARPFRPLKVVPFWLGYGSPVWNAPARFGIKKVYNHPLYSRLFPPQVMGTLLLMIQDYRGSLKAQDRLWQPVKKAVKAWEKAYSGLHRGAKSRPILSYSDGGDFLIISERRYASEDMNHRLKGSSREIYLFCEHARSTAEIVGRFGGLGEEKVLPFLNMMVEKKLMFREGERYLSLAVPLRGYMRRRA
jgi:ribosomal peptide maturation radical SAM protein 1